MRTIIAGSRTIEDYQLIEDAVRESGFDITEIISGGQRSYKKNVGYIGADYFGEQYAERYGLPVVVKKASWDDVLHPNARVRLNRWGKPYDANAGFRRNIAMAEVAEALVAVRKNNSPGTTHMIQEAERRGLKIYVKDVD